MDIVMKWQMHFDQFILLLCIKRARENVTLEHLNRQMSATFVCIHMSAHEYCALAILEIALDCPSYESKLSSDTRHMVWYARTIEEGPTGRRKKEEGRR